MLLEMKDVVKQFGGLTAVSNMSFHVDEGEIYGVIGPNGAGKTTLLKIIMGEESADSGQVIVSKDRTIGYLSQYQENNYNTTVRGVMMDALKPILELQDRMRELEHTMAEQTGEELERSLELYNRYTHEFEYKNGYSCESEANGVLKGLGFSKEDYDRHTDSLSGGQRTRLALGRLLMVKPDIIILDEPTNHLDFETRAWLEEYLSSFKGAILAVSHDRFFLDKIADGICELDNGKLKRYKGNYTEFYAQKKEETKSALKEYEKQRARLAKMEEFVRKNLAASASVNSVGSRVKALEKAERLERPLEEPRDVRFEFGFDAQPVKETLSVKNLSVSVGGKKLFENVDLTLFRGEKLAIVGANGVGKTSFIKALTGEIPFSGRVNWGAGVKTGYFEQECRNLVLSNTVYDEVCRHFSLLTPYDVRSLLARVLIFGDDVDKRVGELSGANRSKVALAILMRKRPNVLVMDEPTNHLDYKAMEGLDKALSDFDGTLLLVSHDRFLLNRVPTRLAELTPDGFRFFSSLDAYTAKAAQKAVVFEKQRSARSESSYKADKKQGRVLRAEKNRLERELTAKEKEAEALAALLSSPQAMSDYKFYNETAKKFQEVQTECDALLEKWMLCEGD